MKNVFVLKTYYTNGYEEYNCASFSKEEMLRMENFIKKTGTLGILEYQNSEILEYSIDDAANTIDVDGHSILII